MNTFSGEKTMGMTCSLTKSSGNFLTVNLLPQNQTQFIQQLQISDYKLRKNKRRAINLPINSKTQNVHLNLTQPWQITTLIRLRRMQNFSLTLMKRRNTLIQMKNLFKRLKMLRFSAKVISNPFNLELSQRFINAAFQIFQVQTKSSF